MVWQAFCKNKRLDNLCGGNSLHTDEVLLQAIVSKTQQVLWQRHNVESFLHFVQWRCTRGVDNRLYEVEESSLKSTLAAATDIIQDILNAAMVTWVEVGYFIDDLILIHNMN